MGGSKSEAKTSSTVNVTTNTIINTDQLAAAIEAQTATMSNAEAAELKARIVIENAKLQQNAAFFSQVGEQAKTAVIVAGLGLVTYKFLKKKEKRR